MKSAKVRPLEVGLALDCMFGKKTRGGWEEEKSNKAAGNASHCTPRSRFLFHCCLLIGTSVEERALMMSSQSLWRKN